MALDDDEVKINDPTGVLAINCPNSLCNGRADGNYELNSGSSYFVQCSGDGANCQSCWPKSLVFSQKCNQCLYSKHGKLFFLLFINLAPRYVVSTISKCNIQVDNLIIVKIILF